MDEKARSELRTYAWNYFSLHATQRLTTFNFYLIISTLLLAGLAAAYKQEYGSRAITMVVGLLIAIVSVVFYKLDIRNRMLISNAERALRYLDDRMGLEDNGEVPHELKLVARDDYDARLAEETQKGKCTFWPSQLHLPYSRCFNLLFFTFGAVGLTSAVKVAYNIIVGA